MDFPEYPSATYEKLRSRGRLAFDLGEVLIEQDGEEKCAEMLTEHRQKQAEKPIEEPPNGSK